MIKLLKTIATFSKTRQLSFIKLTIFYLLATITSMMISSFFSSYFDLQNPNDFSNTSSRTLYENIAILLVFVPIMEEFGFRGGLTFKPYYFQLSLSILFAFVLNYVGNIELFSLNTLLLVSFSFVILMLLIPEKKLDFFKKNRLVIIYTSIFLFGIMHLPLLGIMHIWAVPILVLPQIIVGFFLSFYRIEYGLRMSIIMHTLVNLPFAVLLVIAH